MKASKDLGLRNRVFLCVGDKQAIRKVLGDAVKGEADHLPSSEGGFVSIRSGGHLQWEMQDRLDRIASGLVFDRVGRSARGWRQVKLWFGLKAADAKPSSPCMFVPEPNLEQQRL